MTDDDLLKSVKTQLDLDGTTIYDDQLKVNIRQAKLYATGFDIDVDVLVSTSNELLIDYVTIYTKQRFDSAMTDSQRKLMADLQMDLMYHLQMTHPVTTDSVRGGATS